MVTLRPRKIKATISTKAVVAKNKKPRVAADGSASSKRILPRTTAAAAEQKTKKKTKITKVIINAKPKPAAKKKDSGFKVSKTSTASSLKGAKDPEGILEEYLTTKVADQEAKHDAIRKLHALIREKAPDLAPELQGKGTLAYGGFDYVTKSKCAGRWSRLSIMVNKTGLSLMVCGLKDGKYLLEHYPKKKYFGKASVGKSCIRFSKLEDLNMDHISQVLEESKSADISSMFA